MAPAFLASACGTATQRSPAEHETAAKRSFSDEEKRAAQALSIGIGASQQPDLTPYERALRCRIAFDLLVDRLDQLGENSAQRRALVDAVGLFDQRLSRAGAEANKAPPDIAEDIAKQRTQMAGGVDDARLAIGCIREIQGQANR